MKTAAEIAPITIRGRLFTIHDLEIIQSCVSEYYERGRTYISKMICRRLDWRQPNGWLKDRACRDVLRYLESLEFVQLPPPKVTVRRPRKNSRDCLSLEVIVQEYDITSPVTSFPEKIELEFAKGNSKEKIWNVLVATYHYLGYRVLVGRSIKYLIKSGNRLLGAIGFSSPALHLQPRDRLLAKIGIGNPLDLVVNNSRFLLLPHVQIRNLASHVLALATKQIVVDWSQYYSVTPLVAETFVQPSLFEGTVYRAANWLEIGRTKGYAKKGNSYTNSQEPKKIFLYGLNPRIRRELYKVYQMEMENGTL